MKIKICGLSRIEDIYAANMTMPDYVGFVFAASKRRISREDAKEYKKLLLPEINTVGVFVNEEVKEIVAICEDKSIEYIQLHGNESNQYINELKEQTGLPIIKAIRIKSTENLKAAGNTTADYVLFDTMVENAYGGTGKSFPWEILKNYEKPYFLAGGITVENIEEAKNTNAYCLDISSGAETDGKKNIIKMEELVRRVRI
jgi:phosphoribosylanthranilate isomerase